MSTLPELAKVANELDLKIMEAAELNSGEIPNDLLCELEEINQKLPAKVDSYYWVMSQLSTRAELLKKEAANFTRSARAIENHVDRMETRIKETMLALGHKELAGDHFKFMLSQAKPKLVIEDAKVLPNEMLMQKIETVPDNSKIRDILMSDKEVPGCKLVQGWQLRKYVNNKL